jgi:hypothetical protein
MLVVGNMVFVLYSARRLTSTPIPKDRNKIVAMMAQSSQISFVTIFIPPAGHKYTIFRETDALSKS